MKDGLEAELEHMGILLHEDSLKTGQILDAFLGTE